MMIQPTHTVTAEKAAYLLRNGWPLTDMNVVGELKIETVALWDKDIVFEKCIVACFSGSVTHFDKPVRLVNCHFKNCHFVATYFLGGLIVNNCTFEGYLDFQSGGHNLTGHPVIMTNNDFKGFVNFFDCWYENEVVISNNTFRKGTNLLGKPHNIWVRFDKKPIIKDNSGQLNFDNEGDKPEAAKT